MPAKYRPIREIEFAVAVGFITKEIWREFFSTGGLRWQQMVWRQFKEDRIFNARPDAPHIYLPNRKHPLVSGISDVPAKAPILNQLGHDELVARTFLQLRRAHPRLEILSEAWLKREEPLSNRGARVADYRKHPDLVLVSGGRRIAIEIELNQKSRRRYQAILKTHRQKNFARVIYLVRSPGTKRAIERAANDIAFPIQLMPLGFGSIGELRLNPSETFIRFADSKCLLKDLLK